jgi:hypothetical protein
MGGMLPTVLAYIIKNMAKTKGEYGVANLHLRYIIVTGIGILILQVIQAMEEVLASVLVCIIINMAKPKAEYGVANLLLRYIIVTGSAILI